MNPHRLTRQEYEHCLGRVVTTMTLTAVRNDDHFYLDVGDAQPFRLRILPLALLEQDLLNVVDGWVDLYWPARPVGPDPRLEGYESYYVPATGFNHDGRVETTLLSVSIEQPWLRWRP